MMIIKVGTFVLCHLIVPSGQPGADQVKKINQVPGIVQEIKETDDIEMIDDSYAVKHKKYILLIQPTKNKDEIFTIGSDACRPIVEESEHVEIAKKKMAEKNKPKNIEAAKKKAAEAKSKQELENPRDPVNKVIDTVNEQFSDAPAAKQEEAAPAETKSAPADSDAEKAKLLKELE